MDWLYSVLGLDKTEWGYSGYARPGIVFDAENEVFYWVSQKFPSAADVRESIVLKINEFGQIIAKRHVANRGYHIPIIANNGKLYVAEMGESVDTVPVRVDELNPNDLSYVQEIVSFNQSTELNRVEGLSKASDTILCLTGGLVVTTPGTCKYVKIDVVNKTKTIYSPTPNAGTCSASLKRGNYVYCDRYQQSQGNFKINLTDFTSSAMGTPPNTLNDLVPQFEYDNKLFCGERGAGGRLYDQQIFWYDRSTEAYTEISEYPFNDKYIGNFGAVYFPLLKKAICFRGATRYYSTPAQQAVFDAENDRWQDVSHLFDLLCVPYSTDLLADARVYPIRLSADSCNQGTNFDEEDSLHGHVGPRGFFKDGFYRFLLTLAYRYYDTEERTHLKTIFGIARAA